MPFALNFPNHAFHLVMSLRSLLTRLSPFPPGCVEETRQTVPRPAFFLLLPFGIFEACFYWSRIAGQGSPRIHVKHIFDWDTFQTRWYSSYCVT